LNQRGGTLRKTILIGFVLCSLVLAGAAPGNEKRGPSTPEERQRFLTIVHRMEQAPLDKGLKKDREWALRLLIEIPDVSVSICLAPLGDAMHEKYKYEPEIFGQFTLSMGAFLFEHPEKTKDLDAQFLAGVESALKAYKAILESKPEAKSTGLDQLLEKQKQGSLEAFVHEANQTGCKSRIDRSGS
jgi:hypothetical protein